MEQRGRRRAFLWAAAALGFAVVAGLAGSTAWLGAEAATARPVDGRLDGGSLVLVGGGELPADIRDRFIELAGGPSARIVVIDPYTWRRPSARDHALRTPWVEGGAPLVTVLRLTNRADADDPDRLAPLDDATGVWIGGGDQEGHAAKYVDTLFEQRLRAVLDRRGVVGGTSAGAAVLCRTMIAGGHDPREGRGLDLAPGVVIDQHLLRRNRLGRLLRMLGRYPGLVGLGLDEDTGVVIERRRAHATVVGDSYAVLCAVVEGETWPRIEVLRRGDSVLLSELPNPATRVVRALDLNPFDDDD